MSLGDVRKSQDLSFLLALSGSESDTAAATHFHFAKFKSSLTVLHKSPKHGDVPILSIGTYVCELIKHCVCTFYFSYILVYII